MNVYLLSPYHKKGEMLLHAHYLIEMGYSVVSSWIYSADPEYDESYYKRQDRADRRVKDINNADVLIVFSDTDDKQLGPMSPSEHFDVGYAYSRRTPIVLIGMQEHEFSDFPTIVHIKQWADVIDLLKELNSFMESEVQSNG